MKFKYSVLFVFAALFFAWGSENIVAQTVYEIEGVVYGPDSNALPNVGMTLENHARAQIDQDITKSDGRYRFSGIIAGVYYISIKRRETKFQHLLQRGELRNTAADGHTPCPRAQ